MDPQTYTSHQSQLLFVHSHLPLGMVALLSTRYSENSQNKESVVLVDVCHDL